MADFVALLSQAVSIALSGAARALQIDTDGTLAANSDARLPTQKAVKTYADALRPPRTVVLTDAATVTPNADTTDLGTLATLSQTTTFANPTGTPVNGQSLQIRIKSTSARAVSFGTAYRGSSDLALPTITAGSSKTDYWGFKYNSADSTWDLLATTSGF